MIEHRIKIIKGHLKGKQLKLKGEAITIGRSEECSLFINEQNISRQHARFVKTAQGYDIEDLGSRNGIHVNKNKVRKTPLKSRDKVFIGETVIEYYQVRIKQSQGTDTQAQILGTSINGDQAAGISAGADLAMGSSSKKMNPATRKRIIIYGVSALVLGSLFLSKSGILNKKSTAVQTDTSISETQEQTNKPSAIKETQKSKLSKLNSKETSQSFTFEGQNVSLKELYAKAVIMHDAGNYFQALELLKVIISHNPNHSKSHMKQEAWTNEMNEIGKTLLSKGERSFNNRYYQDAKEYFSQVIDLIPDQKHPLYKRAKSALEELEKITAQTY
ncbi:MAG: FHA domain-containing protein [Pseudomonadota bacterium]